MTHLVPPTEKYLEAARASAKLYQRAGRRESTKYADERTWASFSNYLGPKDPWNATEEEVAAWCVHLAKAEKSTNTIRTYLSRLSYTYSVEGKGGLLGFSGSGIRKDNPANSVLVRLTLRGIRTVHHTIPKFQSPISLDLLERLIDIQPDNAKGIMKKALYAVAWSGALNSLELASLNIEITGNVDGYVEIDPNGISIRLHRWVGRRIGRRWETVCVPTRKLKPQFCTTRLLCKWLEVYGEREGPLFPKCFEDDIFYREKLPARLITRWLKSDLKMLGLPAEKYSGKSLRLGCLDWMVEEGVSELEYMRHACLRSGRGRHPAIGANIALTESAFIETAW